MYAFSNNTSWAELCLWYSIFKLELVYIPEWFTGWPLWCSPPPFWMTKITFDRISRHFRSIRNLNLVLNFVQKMAPFWITENHFWSLFKKISQNGCNMQLLLYFFGSQYGCRWPFWMTENHFRSHFSPFQINTQLFFSQNGCRRSFWMTENNFRSHFSPFQINTQLLFFFHKMAAGGHFGWPKITFDRISRHIRSIRNYVFFHKMAAGGHFGWPKITFNRITRHFRSICNFFFKMAAGGHFGWSKITFDRISRHFRSIHNFF